jgi:osmotically-inducible protein OsmY
MNLFSENGRMMRRIIALIHAPHERTLLAVAAIVTSLAGCAGIGRCGIEGCPEDRSISAEVRALLDEHPELGTPNVVRVQTIDRVVYLRGLVGTPYQKRLAEAIASQADGAARIVNTIGVDNGTR